MKSTCKKTRFHTLGTLLLLLPGFLFAQSLPRKATFYGHENPTENAAASSLSMDLPRRQHLTTVLFDFEKYPLVDKSDLPGRAYYYVLNYKNDSLRHFQIFEGEGVLYLREKGKTYLITIEKSKRLLLFHYYFKDDFWEAHDVSLSDNSVHYVQTDEEDLLEGFPEALRVLSFPDELKGADIKAKKVFAEGLIRRHLLLYERYYNFPKVRMMILESFQELSEDLADAKLPVRIVHGGIGCVFYVPYELVYRDDEWQCWVGGIDEWMVMAAIQRFNWAIDGKE